MSVLGEVVKKIVDAKDMKTTTTQRPKYWMKHVIVDVTKTDKTKKQDEDREPLAKT